jgi:hypothetical protein
LIATSIRQDSAASALTTNRNERQIIQLNMRISCKCYGP